MPKSRGCRISHTAEATAFVRDVVASYRGSSCLLWPYGKSSGYGTLYIDGKQVHAHRLACEILHGPAPAARPHAAHKCGNRACVNPTHLRWATVKENMADKLIHGTAQRGERHGMVKLAADDVRVIRARLATGEFARMIAKDFNVSPSTIHMIKGGYTWQHL